MPVKIIGLFFSLSILIISSSPAEPIKIHPQNPHYFLYNNKPAILITSAEHYGAVINKDFDYVAYFDTLQSYSLNYTRIYPGAYLETENSWLEGNTLGPQPAGLIVPWARSQTPGYALGGNKFDLEQWDTAYFQRLHDFLSKAAERGIIVEICFFNAQYPEYWFLSPLYYLNNTEASGNCAHQDAQTLKNPSLVKREEDYVRKITEEVNSFDNVILEICDEPNIKGTPIPLAGEWIANLIRVIKKTESTLPKKHIITQQVVGPVDGPCDFSANPDISLIVTQYVKESDGEQMGGLKALDLKYNLQKPIEINETYYYPIWYSGDKIAGSRVEAWEFVIGGGAGYNHLNGLFTAKNPRGDSSQNPPVLRALKNLKDFISGFDYIKMSQDKSVVLSGVPADAHCRALSEPGKQYAVYIHHGKFYSPTKTDAYIVNPGKYQEELELSLPEGNYKAEWIDPATGSIIRSDAISQPGDKKSITTPSYTVDIALRILKI